MHDSFDRLRLVLQRPDAGLESNLSLDDLYRGRIPTERGRRGRVAGIWSQSELAGSDRDPSERRQFHLWRNAERSEPRTMHPRPQVAWLQGRLLSIHPHDLGRPALARADDLFARRELGGDERRECVPRRGDDLRLHAGRRQSHGRLFRVGDRLHLSADDPALRLALHDCGRRQSFRARIGAARVGDDPGPRLDQGGSDRRLGTCDMGLSVRRGVADAGQRCSLDFRWAEPDEESLVAREPRRLFRRLVGLDGLPAPRRKRPMAAPRRAMGEFEHRHRRSRQLFADERLDDGRRAASTNSIGSRPRRRDPGPLRPRR